MSVPPASPPELFTNPEVPLESLPGLEELDWQPLHPRFVRRLQAGALFRVLVFVGIVGAAQLSATGAGAVGPPTWLSSLVWTLIAVLAMSWLAWPAIAVPCWGYVTREQDIVYKSGVFWQSVKAVPFNRVQHTRIDSSPLDRRFGLANLSIFPAGAGGHKIRGLGADTAEQLRAFVSSQIEAETGEAADDIC
ncbi:MAG: PH domain-containing protein [Gemmatimonadetes bacterium]|nr:PH domain-containing protein [Gemmatimonadota bacterium]